MTFELDTLSIASDASADAAIGAAARLEEPTLIEFAASERCPMTGTEWIVDAYGCSPDRLRDLVDAADAVRAG